MGELVTITRADGVATLTLNRPPANAMDVELLTQFVDVVRKLAVERPAALVLTGRDGFFSAGADLKAVPNYGDDDKRRMVHLINEMALGVYALRFPVVGAITGHAIAGGLVLALATDLRVASDAGRYGLTEVKVGVPYPKAAIAVVQQELAPHAARRLSLGNELFDAQECLHLGVFDEVVPADQVLARATELARTLAEFPAEVYERTKHELRGQAINAIQSTMAHDPLLAQWVP